MRRRTTDGKMTGKDVARAIKEAPQDVCRYGPDTLSAK
jgi:hypothetical protein